MSLALGDMSVRMLLRGMSEIFLRMFSSRTLMVSRLIFKSFIHLEFIFVYGVSWWSSFIFLHVSAQLSQHHLLKRLFLLHFILLPFCWKLIDCRDLGLFLGSLFCSISLSVFMPVPGCFDYSGLVMQFDIRYCDPFCFALLTFHKHFKKIAAYYSMLSICDHLLSLLYTFGHFSFQIFKIITSISVNICMHFFPPY